MKSVFVALLLGLSACAFQRGYVDSARPRDVVLSPSHPKDSGLTLVSVSSVGVVVLKLPSGERVTAAHPGENFAHADDHSWAIPVLRSVDVRSRRVVVGVLDFG